MTKGTKAWERRKAKRKAQRAGVAQKKVTDFLAAFASEKAEIYATPSRRRKK